MVSLDIRKPIQCLDCSCMDSIVKIMHGAKVNDVSQLKNVPAEVTIENNTFKDFRILTEVL